MKDNTTLRQHTSVDMLRKKISEISLFCNINDLKERIYNLQNKLENTYDKDWHTLQLLMIEKSRLEEVLEEFNMILDTFSYLEELITLEDMSLISEIIKSLHALEKKIDVFSIKCIFDDELDHCNAFLDIKAGSGGLEAQDWASMLISMYHKWATNKNFHVSIVSLVQGEGSGLRQATLQVEGKYANGFLKTETGIHRLVRKSPFDANHKRHTSFASVFVYPEIDKTIELVINPNDLRIDTFRSSGAGGQHVNKTDSAVRITHIPTNTVVQCQNDRSQHKNKEIAMSQLKAKLYQIELDKQKAEKHSLEELKSSISWGNQIRSYVLDQSRIKDLRTGIESSNVQAILNGDLDYFIYQALKKMKEER